MAKLIDELLGDLAEAKRAEEAAKKRRLAAEDAILAMVTSRPEKGRVKLGEAINATIEFKLSYKANVDEIRGLQGVPEDALPLKFVEAGYDFDEKAYEALREGNPKLFARIAPHVTTKPAKPSFELKL